MALPVRSLLIASAAMLAATPSVDDGFGGFSPVKGKTTRPADPKKKAARKRQRKARAIRRRSDHA